jgi:hypothetical protein
MDTIELKAFSAPDYPELCSEFLREHAQVLADFGIPQTVAPDTSWTDDPFCYVIVAMHSELGMVGGIKLQMDKQGAPLPMESTIAPMDGRIINELAQLQPYGNGEVCGLWNANRYANKGIPILLSLAVTAIATQAEAQRMVCFVAHYTKKHPSRNGFIVMGGVGTEGSFDYPIPRIKSIAMVNPDTVLLPFAAIEQRRRIYSLRIRPEQTVVENPSGTELLVKYDLTMKSHIIDMSTYRSIANERLKYTG